MKEVEELETILINYCRLLDKKCKDINPFSLNEETMKDYEKTCNKRGAITEILLALNRSKQIAASYQKMLIDKQIEELDRQIKKL